MRQHGWWATLLWGMAWMLLGLSATVPTAVHALSLDVQDAEVRDVLRLLADAGGVNLVTSGEVQGTVTMRLHAVPWKQALDAVLRLTGLAQERQGNVILVAPAARLQQARQEQTQAQQFAAAAEPRVTRLVPVHYAKAAEMQAHLEKLLGPCATLSVDSRTNTLILQGTPSCLRRLGER